MPSLTLESDITEVLAAWRAAERDLDVLPDGSLEQQRALALVERLRMEYQLLFERHAAEQGDGRDIANGVFRWTAS